MVNIWRPKKKRAIGEISHLEKKIEGHFILRLIDELFFFRAPVFHKA